MRILYHHRTRAEDGQAIHVRSLIEAFVEEGHEVLESALVRHAAAPERVAAGGARAAGPTPREAWSWVGRLPRAALELAEYAYSVPARRRLLGDARRFAPDFLYERYAFGNQGGVRAAADLGLPIVLEVNSPMVHELSWTRGLRFPALGRRIERRVWRAATRVAAVSGVLAEMLIAEGVERERVLLTPNGVRLELYGRRTSEQARALLGVTAPEGPLLGFVGYPRAWHRLELVARLLADPGLAGAHLVVIGEGPGIEPLREAARRAGTGPRVHCLGSFAHARIPDLLPAFDVALVPAINPYASPLKLFEYMAAGLAVVAPDQPNLREVVNSEENGLLVPPDDPARLASAIARLAADAGLRLRLGRAARRTIEERDLTWRGNARRVVRAVESPP